jgi:hypothetical protein
MYCGNSSEGVDHGLWAAFESTTDQPHPFAVHLEICPLQLWGVYRGEEASASIKYADELPNYW